MKAVWKFDLRPYPGEDIIEMPYGALLRCVALQGGQPRLWAEIDDELMRARRVLRTIGTGQYVNGDLGEYVGTYQLQDGDIIAHVYDGGWRP